MQTAFDSWLTETPEDQDDRIEAREARRANRAEPDHDNVVIGTGLQRFESDPLNYLNFDSGVAA